VYEYRKFVLLATTPPFLDAGPDLGFAHWNMSLRSTAALMFFVFFFAGSLLAQQTRPADKRFTEDQLKTFLVTEKDWVDQSNKIMQEAANSKTDPANLAVGRIGQLYQACLDRHRISREDFESIGERVAEAYDAVTYLDGSYKTSLDHVETDTAPQNASLADAQKQLAIYEEAEKNGWRLLSAEDREAAIKSALAEQQTALDEVKQRSEDVNTNETEAVQHDADAKVADDQAKNPPSDVSADDRSEYIQNKKNEAVAARASAKEARVGEADSKSAQNEAQTRADAAGQRAAHPEIPVTDEQKSQVKSDNDAAIKSAQSAISAAKERLAKIAKGQADLQKTAQTITKGVPPENIELMRQYADQYRALLADARGTAATQPTR
jgi:hypothetical protein